MIRLIPKEKFEFIVNLNIQYLICKYTMNTTYNWKLYNDIISEFKNESEMFEWLKYDSLLDKPAPRELTSKEQILVKVYNTYPQFNLFNDISNRYIHLFNDFGIRVGYLNPHDSDMEDYCMSGTLTKYFFQTYRNKITVKYQSNGQFYNLVDTIFTDPMEAYNVLCKLDPEFDSIVGYGNDR